MKAKLTLLLAVLWSLQAFSYTVYFSPLRENPADYQYAVWHWGNCSGGQWSDWMSPVNGHEGWYSISLPDGCTNLIFATFNNTMAAPNWNSYISQTSDLMYDPNKLYYKEGTGWQASYVEEEHLYNVSIGDFNYNLNVTDHTAEVIQRWLPLVEGDTLLYNYANLTNAVIPASFNYEGQNYTVNSISDDAFLWSYQLASVTIPNSVTNIGVEAFYGCYRLKQVTIGNAVSTISKMAFYNCDSLESINIPQSVENIGLNAFYGCRSLASISLGSISTLGQKAFMNCTGLSHVEIPNSLTALEDYTFSGCIALDTIVNNALIPQSLGEHVFDSVHVAQCRLIVPEGAVNAYKATPVWQNFDFGDVEPIVPEDSIAAPSVADLALQFGLIDNNVVLCLYFDETPCNGVYFVGTPNNWAKGNGTTEDFSNCTPFVPVNGHEGWYAVSFPYSANVAGKPVHAKADGSFSWSSQGGAPDAWVNRGGEGSSEALIVNGTTAEADIYYPAPGYYIYEMLYWKNHHNPCEIKQKHHYTIYFYSPDACPEMKPALLGDFNNWSSHKAMTETVDIANNTVYVDTIYDEAGSGFKFRELEDLTWDNPLLYFHTTTGRWTAFQNFILPETTQDTALYFQFSDNLLYRYAMCDRPEDMRILFRAPSGAPENVALYGSMSEYTNVTMQYNDTTDYWTAVVNARESDIFSFRDAANEDNILVYPVGEEWVALMYVIGNFSKFYDPNVYSEKVLLLEPDSEIVRWAFPGEVTPVGTTEAENRSAVKIYRNGQILILRGDQVYTVTGQEVR